MPRMIALITLTLLVSACSSNNLVVCPKRPAYEGVTWGDLARYLGSLERLYDSCAGQK